MQAEDESNITELEILPDGRICVFGASREVLEIFKEIPIHSQTMILQRLKQHDMIGPDDVSLQPKEQIRLQSQRHKGINHE